MPTTSATGSVSRFFDPHRASMRIMISVVTGILVTGLSAWQKLPLPLLVGWNMGGTTLLLLAWSLIVGADDKITQERAGSEDPGRTLVYGVVIFTSLVSLIAALQVSRHVNVLPPGEATMAEVMCLLTVALAWGLTHTAFTLRYAHLYYREDDQGVGGVDFPEKCTPSYFDFAYFAFTIGMCFQTSDACVSSAQIRKVVLLHAVISFAYNSVILAFVLNLVFGMAT
jgi:uncharacterized membrane protein